jgi:hypothetical protein
LSRAARGGSVSCNRSGICPRRAAIEGGRRLTGLKEGYEAPRVMVLGDFPVLTLQQFDKIGSRADLLTLLLPMLDGSIVPD